MQQMFTGKCQVKIEGTEVEQLGINSMTNSIQNIQEMTFNDRDEFQRKAISEKVITLLQSTIDISPMIIDGGWGAGKTEFCHKLKNLMAEKDTHHLIYIDAFQADHTDEPLMTVLAEVLKLLPEGSERDGFLKKALPAVRYGVKTLAKASIAHLLRQDATSLVDDFEREIQQVADDTINASVESMLKDHVKADESLIALKNALREISEKKPIIIFIDELDRCRPDFAVYMLEIIKHTFDVNGVQFIFITNIHQIKASINHCYGTAVDAHKYLDKFIKFSFSLPNKMKDKSSASMHYYKKLINENSILSQTKLTTNSYLNFVQDIVEVNDISLREIETFIRHAEIYNLLTNEISFSKNSIWGYMLLEILGILLFSLKPDLGKSIINGTADSLDLSKFLGETTPAFLMKDVKKFKETQVINHILRKECLTHSGSQPSGLVTSDSNQLLENTVNTYFQGGIFIHDERYGETISKVFSTLCLYECY